MSYLDVPRIHFSGEFRSDPSTANNILGSCCDPGTTTPPTACSHNNAVTIDGNAALEGWNKDGTHRFQLVNCVIGSVVDATGAVLTTSAQDRLVGGTVATTDEPRPGRLVDLDPMHQTSSQLWGLGLRVRSSTGEQFSAQVPTATLRDLWFTRAPGGFARGVGGTYQTVLNGAAFVPATGPFLSVVLNAFIGRRISLKMVLHAYDAVPTSPNFTVGKVVGTLGIAGPDEPIEFVPERRLVHAGTTGPTFGVAPFNSAAHNTAPFKVDASRRVLVLDLGNALPESAPAGPPRALGAITPQIVHPNRAPESLGTVTHTAASYLRNAGVVEVPLTARQASDLAVRRLQLMGGSTLILAERAAGIHVDVSEVVVRLNPGEQKDLELRVSQFGRPMPSANVFIAATQVGPGAGRSVTALSIRHGAGFGTTLALGGVVQTGANGRVTVRLVAGDPAHPRQHVDGQVSFLGFFIGSVSAANQRGQIVVRVFDRQTVPAAPTFANIRPFLLQYFRMYPSMRFINLSDEAVVRQNRGLIAAAVRRAETDPGYMPVTRDLSRDNKTMLLRWLDAQP